MTRFTTRLFVAGAIMAMALPVWSDDALSKLSIHGFLIQAFAISDGNQIYGIPDDGTTDYRTAALQLKYALTVDDEFVLQLSHESLGNGLEKEIKDDVDLDWIFYSRKITDNTRLRVGRVPLPSGIYNEIKDVGTLLPFFRASANVYGDGTWTSDSVDGLVLSHGFAPDSSWPVDVDIYYGEWESIEADYLLQDVAVAQAKNAVGFQVWLNTPLEGLRVGVGANRYDYSGGLYLEPGVEQSWKVIILSVDGDFGPVVVRAEYLDMDYGDYWKAWNGEVLVDLTEQLRMTAWYDYGKLKMTIPFFAVFEDTWSEDYALGLNFAFRPDLVLKLEHHWHEGFDIEDPPVDPFFESPHKANYTILSLSTHF